MSPRRRYLPRILLILLALFILGYAGASSYLWLKQRELIFLPSRELKKTPADFQLSYEEVWLPSRESNSICLHGWWLPADDSIAAAFLYLHGNGGSIGDNVEHVDRLRRMGFSVLIVDYRGYGRSGGGFPSETRVYEDAETAWTYLITVRHVNPSRTFIYGHSLGGAIAVELALRHPEAAGLIVESTFTSVREMAERDYGLFPVNWLLNQRFDTLAKAPLLRVPVLFIHGTADTVVPYTMSERLFNAVQGSKWLALIPGAGHEDSATVGGTQYADAVLGFMQNVQRGHQSVLSH